MEKQSEESKLKEFLIQAGLKIARRGEGALFVVGETKYKTLVKQTVLPFKVMENPKLLESLALMDGAVIIRKDGTLEAYGAMIKATKTLKNFGTRHSAALSASFKGNISIVISEEDRKVRVMQNGKMTMQLDALEKNVEKSVHKAVDFLESVGAGTIGALGTSLIVPGLGLALVPGIVVFGSGYYLTKLLRKKKK